MEKLILPGMENQSHLFQLEQDVHYLNCAYMSPLLKAVEKQAISEIEKRRNPQNLTLADFFDPVSEVKKLFSNLIGGDDPDRIAIVPSASYGLATAALNMPARKGGKIVLLEGQFPSNYYVWKKRADSSGMKLEIVNKPTGQTSWSEKVLNTISPDTAAVVIAPVHWADGSKFDCSSIGERCKETESYFILDGTQAIGASEFDIGESRADALICAGYKWLMGPYSFGLAYYGPKFDNGNALEENWFSKVGSDDFANLVDYQEEFRPKAWRYNVGECSNFIYIKMMIAALKQIMEWSPSSIQNHCAEISSSFIGRISEMGFSLDAPDNRARHLFGILPTKTFSWEEFNRCCTEKKVLVSHRGPYIRVSPHLYNTAEDFTVLEQCLQRSIA